VEANETNSGRGENDEIGHDGIGQGQIFPDITFLDVDG
jgi:hypothetical protein